MVEAFRTGKDGGTREGNFDDVFHESSRREMYLSTTNSIRNLLFPFFLFLNFLIVIFSTFQNDLKLCLMLFISMSFVHNNSKAMSLLLKI